MRRIALWLLVLALALGGPGVGPVRAAGLTAQGRVADLQGRPLAGALVQAVALGGGVVAEGLAGAGGRYGLALPPAVKLWQVRAWADGHRLAESGWLGPWTMGDVDLTLVPAGGVVAGTLRDAAGVPAAGRVLVLSEGGHLVAEAEAGTGGRFELPAPPGRWRVTGMAGGDLVPEKTVQVRDGSRLAVELRAVAGTVTVRGRLAGPDGSGPAGASVAVLRDGHGVVAAGPSGAGGEFKLAVPPASEAVYRLRVLAPGFAVALTEPFAAPAGSAVEFSGRRAVPLVPAAATVVGSVAGLDGLPLRNIPVWLELQGVGNVAEGQTGEDGRFRFDGLAPGADLQYRVRLEPAYHRMTTSAWFALAGGEVRSEAFVLVPPAVAVEPFRSVLAGRVTDPAGRPVAGAEVLVRRDGYAPAEERLLTDGDGLFRTLLWAGQAGSSGYRLRVSAPGFLPTAQVGGAADGVVHMRASGVVNLQVTLHLEQVTLQGRVEHAGGRLFPGAAVRLIRGGTGTVAAAVAGVDGSYRFPGLPRGTYLVEAEAPGHGRADTGPLALVADLPPAVLPALRLRPTGGTVLGQITDPGGLPLAGVTVAALDPAPTGAGGDADAPGGPLRAAVTDGEGRFRLEDLPVGVPFALRADGNRHRTWVAAPLTLAAGEAREVAAVLFPDTGCLTARVRTDAGAPAPGAAVQLYREGAGRPVATATADLFGDVQFDDLPVLGGWYALAATGPGGASGTGSLFPLLAPAAGACTSAELLLSGPYPGLP